MPDDSPPITLLLVCDDFICALAGPTARVWKGKKEIVTLKGRKSTLFVKNHLIFCVLIAADYIPAGTGTCQWRGGGLTTDSKLILGAVSRGKSPKSYLTVFDGDKSTKKDFSHLLATVETTLEPQTCVSVSSDSSLVACGTVALFFFFPGLFWHCWSCLSSPILSFLLSGGGFRQCIQSCRGGAAAMAHEHQAAFLFRERPRF